MLRVDHGWKKTVRGKVQSTLEPDPCIISLNKTFTNYSHLKDNTCMPCISSDYWLLLVLITLRTSLLNSTFAECDNAGATTTECCGGTSLGVFVSTALGFTSCGVWWRVSSTAAACSFNRLTEMPSLGSVPALSSTVSGTAATPAVVPLVTARRATGTADSGVNRDDGRGGVDLDFLLVGWTVTSCTAISITEIWQRLHQMRGGMAESRVLSYIPWIPK